VTYNYIRQSDSLLRSNLCKFDTNVGFETDFSVNADVDGWTYYDGIHTYGCWNGFLFGTSYTSYAVVGRANVFAPPLNSRNYYTVSITMRLKCKDREGSHSLPLAGKIMWRTLSDTSWNDDKTLVFNIYPDNTWHTYNLNMGEAQWWQGDINDIRLYPFIDCMKDDEFFIQNIKILSISTFMCTKGSCSYISNYSHPCGGIGNRFVCESSTNTLDLYTIEKDVNDEIIININNYGDETIIINPKHNISGFELARELTKAITKTGVGGYAEAEVKYNNENKKFSICSGTYTDDSSMTISYSSAAVYMGFYNDAGIVIYTTFNGKDPADSFIPESSFLISTDQILSLFDSENTDINFNPYSYAIEGGRSDWLESTLGLPIFSNELEDTNLNYTTFELIDNRNKTIIDFNHPFNASGRISKITIACTLDNTFTRGINEADRDESSDCKVIIVRPRKDGSCSVIHVLSIPNRVQSVVLYSALQEYTEISCDILVNKGDLIGVYNANIYTGLSVGGLVDAQYYQLDNQISGTFNPGTLYGEGAAGLLFYARSNFKQKTLALDIDLGNRININDVVINGTYENVFLEFNIARCLDINWTVNLFNGQHETSYLSRSVPNRQRITHNNVAYGINNLSDGVYIVPDGKAADSFSMNSTGIVPSNPHYFWVNGDCEWLGVFQNASNDTFDHVVEYFVNDPIALTLLFPYSQTKNIYKSKIFFKEYNNFRSFALSTYLGSTNTTGNADDKHFKFIPEYTKITLNGIEYYEGSNNFLDVNEYIFKNPCDGEPKYVETLNMTSNGGFWDGRGYGYIDDFYTYQQVINTDWTTITHEWETIPCEGFRIYCDYHNSTKITEIEVFCESDFEGTALINGISLYYSKYNDLWWNSDITTGTDSVIVNIFDTPRYFKLNISPASIINLKNILFNVKSEDVYVGEKGCESVLLLDNCKIADNNLPNKFDIKNIYGTAYDLYVDIAVDNNILDSLLFYSKMNSVQSITNPEVGPDAAYYKEPDYILTMSNGNCAINSECYGLKNLVEGKKAYYSYDDAVKWYDYGILHNDVLNSFSNHAIEYSEMYVPIINRNRYWKIKPTCSEVLYSVREIKTFFEGEELSPTYYHEKTLNVYSGPLTDTAPHINNGSVIGSYYTIGSQTIGIDLGSAGSIDKIRLYHNSIVDWSYTYGGIDKYTSLCLGVDELNTISDLSYNQQTVNIYGNIGVDPNGPFPGSSRPKAINFGGTQNDYISIPYNSVNNVTNRRGTFDFWVKFRSLPANNGDYVVLARNWGCTLPPNFTNGTETLSTTQCSYCFLIRNVSGFQRLEFHYVTWRYQQSINHFILYDLQSKITFNLNTWYYIAVAKCPYIDASEYNLSVLSVNNVYIHSGSPFTYYSEALHYEEGFQNIIIGKGLDGSIADFRIMRGSVKVSVDDEPYEVSSPEGSWKTIGTYNSSTPTSSTIYTVKPTIPWTKYYAFDIFVSSDDITYGYYCSTDLWQDHTNNYYYYDVNNKFNYSYYSYFAIDLNKRYSLDIIRNYGASDAMSLTGNILYSNTDTSDINNVEINSGSLSDARWLIFRLYNDATVRKIRKIGIYPNINTVIAPGGGYNKEWDSLGSSISNYETNTNVALYSDVTASSYWGNQLPSMLTTGVIGSSMAEAWLSDTNSTQWIVVDLGVVRSVYRFKIYHGYDTDDTEYMINDYSIQTSVSGSVYQTQFSINSNSSFERTHDLLNPVEARYIKINITNYTSMYKYIRVAGESGYFGGAVLRQIEVYNYYGYSVISSEQYPIIAINLKDQFYISSHSVIGINTENTSTDWSNDNINFSYCDSVLYDPRKIAFNDWGTSPGYDQWVAVKRDTATNYNSGPDYLKHIVISAIDAPNPCDNDWWWTSTFSTISRDYTTDTNISIYGLKIEYPASSGIEYVYLRGGDDFGIDDTISWRDNFYFRMHVDDINNIDLSYGYIYFGGNDISNSKNIVSYQWYFSTLSGSLNTGWNTLNLKFKNADNIEYTEQQSPYNDPRIFSNLTMSDIGIMFRGIGNPIVIRFDGFKIKRNHFDDDSAFSKGLYLTGNDYVSCPLSNFSMSKGTVEFWLRPDYTSAGMDFFNIFKNRSLFTVSNVDNDVLGVAITISGFSIYFGRIEDTLTTYYLTDLDINIDELIHFAFVYSNTGKHISSDGSTIRLYINNILVTKIVSPWVLGDNKHCKFTIGGQSPMAIKESSPSMDSSSISGIISDFKIYNYCKTDFYDSINNIPDVYKDVLVKPSELISISKDNLTYYNVGDDGIPFLFEKVPNGNSVPIYVKSNIPKGLTYKEKRTSGLIIQWDIGV
jgi:hypothetical protein